MSAYNFFTISLLILLFFGSCKKKELDIEPQPTPPAPSYDFTPIEGSYIFNHTFMYRSYVNPNAPLHYEEKQPDTFAVALPASQRVQVNGIQLYFFESDSEIPDFYYFTDNDQPPYYSIYYTCKWYPANDSISFIRYEREPNGLHVDAWTGVLSPL